MTKSAAASSKEGWPTSLSTIGRVLLAMSLGGVLTFAFAPHHIILFSIVAYSGLFWLLLRSPSTRSSAVLGWSFGSVHFASSLYWIGFSFLVDADRFSVLAIPAVLGLSAFLGLFPALACAGTFRIACGRSLTMWLAFAAFWSLGEWLRGHFLGGFPWNLTGYVWTADEPLQVTSAVGIYGLSFVTVAIASMPGLALQGHIRWRMRFGVLGATGFAVAGLWLSGDLRLSRAGAVRDVAGVRLRLVQPNIPQHLKWRPDQRRANADKIAALATRPAPYRPTHVLWPETATPVILLESEYGLGQVADLVPEDAFLVTGIVRKEPGEEGRLRVLNSVAALSKNGEVMGVYDKVRLVPFGEYVPLRGILPFKKITEGAADFSSGREISVLSVPGVPPFRPMICYEAIFPGDWPASAEQPSWLLNLTNDAWFGDSLGPYQHFQMTRVRAVERGLPMVRVANTGISAVIDAYGRVRASLPLNSSGILDSPLPGRVINGTLFGRVGNGPFFIMIALSLFQAVRTRTPRSRNRADREA